jgi:hypothetical protein
MQGQTPDEPSSGLVITVLRYLAYLSLWLLLVALAAVLGWSLRTNLFDVGIWLRWNPWVVRGIDRWAIFLLGLLWLIFFFATEGYLRAAVPQRRLWAKARALLIIVLILLVISYGLQLPAVTLLFNHTS